jgi:primosomal protein N' (replication factor Y) (superfamily II helicase)
MPPKPDPDETAQAADITPAAALTLVRVAVPRPLYRLFDYTLPPSLPRPLPGARVRVPFGRQSIVGICVEADSVPATTAFAHPLKPVSAVLDDVPLLSPDLFALLTWAAAYYHHPIGETLFTALPTWLRDGRSPADFVERRWIASASACVDALPRTASRLRATLRTVLANPDGVADDIARGTGADPRSLRVLADRGLIMSAAGARDDGTPAFSSVPPVPSQLTLTSAQRQALDAITSARGYACFLLDGVTGSGKTEVYLRALAHALGAATPAPAVPTGPTIPKVPAAQALVLIPEIALTPQTLARFEQRFAGVAGYHSDLGERERARIWHDCATGRCRILIGTRSAVLVPFANLKLIVVDEEHDGSFKQQEGLRYSARDLAVKRARDLDIPLVLGSATPALESLRNVALARYRPLALPERTNRAPAPALKLIDIRGLPLDDGISAPLARTMRQHLAAGNQVLLFINRRGYAPSLVCTRCGWCPGCARCEVSLTVHRQPPGLRCHHCGSQQPLPEVCGQCGANSLRPIGHGTQRTETAIERLFADVPVVRVDRDSVRRTGALARRLDQINEGKPSVLVGTQMLAKGHHFPAVTLVGVLNADAGLFSTDFRAPEHTAQLIVQVAGRAGRAERPGEVWIQTYNPTHPLLTALVNDGYAGFARTELRARDSSGLPPASHLAVLRAEAPTLAAALDVLTELTAGAHPVPAATSKLDILGPVPAALVKRANRYRAQALVLAATRATLHRTLDRIVAVHGERRLPGIRWHIDVDPYDLA